MHKEDKKGKTEAGRWRGERRRAETDGEKRPGTDFLSALSSLLPIAPPGLLRSHLSASPSTSSLTCSLFVFQPDRLTSCLSIPWGVAPVSGAASRHNHFYFCSWMKEDTRSTGANERRMLKHPHSGPAKPKVCVQSWLFTRCVFILEMNASNLSEKIFYLFSFLSLLYPRPLILCSVLLSWSHPYKNSLLLVQNKSTSVYAWNF